ncbi:hypothetical protein Pelo_10780 [Pelomyxa schiedti]|nr:hypothetical protein Pelo_10780 [Pelomyxa schiedti]
MQMDPRATSLEEAIAERDRRKADWCAMQLLYGAVVSCLCRSGGIGTKGSEEGGGGTATVARKPEANVTTVQNLAEHAVVREMARRGAQREGPGFPRAVLAQLNDDGTSSVTEPTETPNTHSSMNSAMAQLHESVRCTVLPSVERYFSETSAMLLRLVHRKETTSRGVRDASVLYEAVRLQKVQLISDRNELASLRRLHFLSSISLSKTLVEEIHFLIQLILKYKVDKEHTHNLVSVERLCAESYALSYKLMVIHQRILSQTYIPENITKLRQMRNDLIQEHFFTKQEIERTKHTLSLYHQSCTDPSYQSLLQQYTALLRQRESTSWALANFGPMDKALSVSHTT